MSLQKTLLQFEPVPENILPAVKKISQKEKYISEKECEAVAEYFSVSKARVFSVVSFFDQLKTRSSEKKIIRVCSGGPCLSEKSKKIVRQIELLVGAEMENDANPKYKIEFMSCIGLCDRGPVIEIGGQIFEKVKPEMVDDILRSYLL